MPHVADDFVQRANGFGRQFCAFHSDYDIFCIYEPMLHNSDPVVMRLSDSVRVIKTPRHTLYL